MSSLVFIVENLLKIEVQLMKFACSLTFDREEARDLMQDTILKTLENREKFAENTNFKSWAFTIMKNLFINSYRKKQSYSHSFIDITDVAEEIANNDCSDYLYDYKYINQIISHLSDRHRHMFGLYVSQYKYEEIAQKMNIPVGTLKREIHMIKVSLRKKLTEFQSNTDNGSKR
ncbi:MAG: RNA polymerase sigma factor [Coprobacter sp.]|nr:RNA polymerase sigma factor [Coprobacter sp.]